MKWLDRRLQDWRLFMAQRYIRQGALVLDVGCPDGHLFATLRRRASRELASPPV
jgi:2-polyprenyl-3-methyl-5-hydroxy-6-metoxy-1,4-benzoquinol methylase